MDLKKEMLKIVLELRAPLSALSLSPKKPHSEGPRACEVRLLKCYWWPLGGLGDGRSHAVRGDRH